MIRFRLFAMAFQVLLEYCVAKISMLSVRVMDLLNSLSLLLHVTELSSLVKSMALKSCILEPLPGSLMKDCIEVLLPAIKKVIILSLSSTTVPLAFKEAMLNPIIKKDNLDHEIFKNFRPISNLRFISRPLRKLLL